MEAELQALGLGPDLAAQLGALAKTPEDLAALLQYLGGQEGDAAGAAGAAAPPPDLAEMLRNVRREKGVPTEEVPTEEITPEPGFVVKTQDMATSRKVFINMCCHPKVAAPGNWANGTMPESVQNALENMDNLSEAEASTLRFPLSMSSVRQEADKKGEPCTTLDCCLNKDVLAMAAKHRPLKSFLIELAMNWVNHKHKMELDPKYKLPKMRYKGQAIEAQRIRVDKKPLVTEVKEVEEEPTFALRASLPPPPTQKQQAAEAAGPAAHAGEASSSSSHSASSHTTGSVGAGAVGHQRAAQPGASGSALRLVGGVECHGRPVDAMSFHVELPATVLRQQQPPTAPTPQQGWSFEALHSLAGVVRVEVCGRNVFVSAPGTQELKVGLPFAAEEQGAAVQLEAPTSGHAPALLRVRVPYAPLASLLAQAAAQKPHTYGQLGLASSAALELEP